MLVKPKVCVPRTLLLHFLGKLSSKLIVFVFENRNYSTSLIQSVHLMGRVGFFRDMLSHEKKSRFRGYPNR